MPVTVRPAHPDEREALEALQWRASLANPADRDALLAHPDAIDLPREQLDAECGLVAEIGGAVVGFAIVLPRSDGDAELDGLFVEPERWRSGAGRALVDAACTMARNDRGARALHVIANPEAKGFYERCGFVAEAPFQTRFGPALRMRRSV